MRPRRAASPFGSATPSAALVGVVDFRVSGTDVQHTAYRLAPRSARGPGYSVDGPATAAYAYWPRGGERVTDYNAFGCGPFDTELDARIVVGATGFRFGLCGSSTRLDRLLDTAVIRPRVVSEYIDELELGPAETEPTPTEAALPTTERAPVTAADSAADPASDPGTAEPATTTGEPGSGFGFGALLVALGLFAAATRRITPHG
ncbi:hypothetical protein [Halorientalis sp.]|uniref:hypothetical protein n=1 Tax=Halorientalis sp. TaxID=1931229 RepID=UPI00262E677F|nr:hypothetical protein [Halorientalis sp.]